MLNSHTLISWYQLHKRDLPWRHTSDPYAIWLSEIILQQTRVSQGLDYYYAFLDAYPSVQDLANASEQEVLKLWQGLGYYSRARNLHTAAQTIAGDMNGTFPDTYAEIIKLKGVGPYTAAAIASFAFGEFTPVIDGNVQRVVSRWLGLDEPVDTTPGKKAILQVLQPAIEKVNPAHFNQAIMELGATVCTPKNPTCTQCPLAENCHARATHSWDQFPQKKSKTKVQNRYLHCFLFSTTSHQMLRKRGIDGIWKNMFDLPSIEFETPPSAQDVRAHFDQIYPDHTSAQLTTLEQTTHILSHRKLHVTLHRVEPPVFKGTFPANHHWILREEQEQYPIPRLTERLLEKWGKPTD